MKSHFRFGVISLALLVAPVAMAASISFLKKEMDPKEGLTYFYTYTCASGFKGTLSVSAANDNAAQKLGEVKARRICEEI